ncbi:MAG: hypothetical protein MUE42_12110 [Opitutaceae bacterium]|nr:hypothetical protein [Opitutaceae bacterium]
MSNQVSTAKKRAGKSAPSVASSAGAQAAQAVSVSKLAQRTTPAPLFDWLRTRQAGVLMHPTSLPSEQGIGVLDGEVDAFLDFLHFELAGLSARSDRLRGLALPVFFVLRG